MKKPGMGADVAGRHHRPRRGDDRSIRARLLGVLGREEWAWMWPEDIIVRDGIVHLWISADEPLEKRQALRRGGKDPRGPRRHGT
jgi:hypothetical protein